MWLVTTGLANAGCSTFLSLRIFHQCTDLKICNIDLEACDPEGSTKGPSWEESDPKENSAQLYFSSERVTLLAPPSSPLVPQEAQPSRVWYHLCQSLNVRVNL